MSVPAPRRTGPDPYADSFTGLVVARALTTAVLLGVFDALHEKPATASDLAVRLGLDPLGAATLLTTLTALGYLRADGDVLHNTAVTEEQLVRSAPGSIHIRPASSRRWPRAWGSSSCCSART